MWDKHVYSNLGGLAVSKARRIFFDGDTVYHKYYEYARSYVTWTIYREHTSTRGCDSSIYYLSHKNKYTVTLVVYAQEQWQVQNILGTQEK